MNKENIKKWVEALRSGQYKQGRGMLRFKDEFCCLGVACEVAKIDGVPIETTEDEWGGICYDGSPNYLPTSVANWLDMGVFINVHYKYRDMEEADVMAMNDTLKLDFNTIADALEKTYLAEKSNG